jgi:RNA polymerase sigma factor (sigma-70 family)
MKSHSKSSQELEILFDQYNNLIVSQALFFIHSIELDELLQIARLGAIKSFQSYNAELGPLIPYLKVCIRNEILDVLKSETRYNNLKLTKIDKTPKESIFDYIPELTPDEELILKYKLLGLTRNEIVEKMDISLPILNIRIHKLYNKIRESNEN